MSIKRILDNISICEINNTISYDPQTGIFTWKKSYGPRRAGNVAGHISTNGYRRIYINGKIYAANRLAWIIYYGEEPIGLVDHINGNREDDRISNLRIATYSQNSMNSKLSSLNSSGFKGVSWKKESKKWVATGKLDGKRIHLGYYTDIEDAKQAYCNFASKHHGEFYRSN
ncbi:HNH endonuclease [Atlantibacter hermannii]|uniref:HNH endonuclease n=1 Tax=Atlantibacter hermannii TaxID=565 RepID=UPI00289B7437|nr:HNH endonuclease [Atlantibacter hermannii]